MPEMLLVRHCQSQGPAPDAPLTVEGHREALNLAAHLEGHPIDVVISSPYRRAIETITPYARSRGLGE